MKDEILDTIIKSGEKVKIYLGNQQAIKIRIEGWEEVKKENLVLIAPEATLNLSLPKSVKARQKAVSKDVSVKIMENIVSPESLGKNLKRIGQGIEVRYYKHHGFSLVIRDGKTVIIEIPFVRDELMNIRIEDELLAKVIRDYYFKIWERALPLDNTLIEKLRSSFEK